MNYDQSAASVPPAVSQPEAYNQGKQELGWQWPARPEGVFHWGDQVQLTDGSGRKYTITLEPQGWFNVHRGSFAHQELVGKPEGTLVVSREGREYLAFRPRRLDYVLSMPRGAAIIYPKDAGQILQSADIYTGARVFECGVGSGALSLTLLNMIGPQGKLVSLEARAEFAQIAQANVELWFGSPHPAWHLLAGKLGQISTQELRAPLRQAQGVALQEQGSSCDELPRFNRAILDLLDPWEYLDTIAELLEPGGVLCAYVTTIPQVSALVEELANFGCFSLPQTTETIERPWHVEGLAIRPEHAMIGHSGFLVTTRRLAPGSRRIKPKNSPKTHALSSRWTNEENWEELAADQRVQSRRKTRRVLRDVSVRQEKWVKDIDTRQMSD